MIIKKNSKSINKIKNKSNLSNQTTISSKNEEIVMSEENIQNDNEKNIQDTVIEEKAEEPTFDLFDIENIDFSQRQERRKGSRRRGYRRIDDRNLVSRAEEESELIKKSAFEEGYRNGIEQANSDLQQFRNQLTDFMQARQEVFEYIAPDILEISVDIAKKIIKKELETDPQIIINIIIDVLKNISKNEPKVSIKVKPQAIQFIKETLPNITYQYGIDAKINVIGDASLEDGSCIFETNNGIVDASINTQIEIIKKAFDGC